MNADTKTVNTPGIRPSEAKEEDDDEDELEASEASKYRESVARANYIARNRTDIAFATKKLSRGMSKPNKGNTRALKRLSRYLMEGQSANICINKHTDMLKRASIQIMQDAGRRGNPRVEA